MTWPRVRVRIHLSATDWPFVLVALALVALVLWALDFVEAACGVLVLTSMIPALRITYDALEPLPTEPPTVTRDQMRGPLTFARCEACHQLRPSSHLTAGGFCRGGCPDDESSKAAA